MNRLASTAVVLILAASVASCGKNEAAAPAATAASPSAPSSAVPAPPSADVSKAAGPKMAKGSGTVKAIDPASGTITLAHGPIPEANWPAMTMAFKAGPAVTGAAKPGDKVNFDVKLENGSAEVTAVRRQ